MGRRKKKSIRCKTSKRDNRYSDKTLKSPPNNRIRVPLNQVIDQNGKSSKVIHDQIVKQNKSRPTPTKHTVSPAIKMKIDRFLFGQSPRPNLDRSKTHNILAAKSRKEIIDIPLCDDDSKQNYFLTKDRGQLTRQNALRDDDFKEAISGLVAVDETATTTATTNIEHDDEGAETQRYDVLELRNLDRRVLSEKLIQKIVNKKLAQIYGRNGLQISLKAVSILKAGGQSVAKITVRKAAVGGEGNLAEDIRRMLDGKKLFGKALRCGIVDRKQRSTK